MRALLLMAVVLTVSVHAANWAQWRGPAFDGTSPETGLPEKFGPGENELWATPLSGIGASTPAIWDNHVFVTVIDTRSKEAAGVCLDRKTGKILWQKGLGVGSTQSSQTKKNTHATSSPVTNGKHVWFTFGNGDMACFDLAGNLVWSKNLIKDYGPLTFMHGFSSTPLLLNDKLYLPLLRNDIQEGGGSDVRLESYLVCLDGVTGKEAWKHVRKPGGKLGAQEGYTSPIPNAEGTEIILTGADAITGHDAKTGNELWRWTGFFNPGNSRTVASALLVGDVVMVGGSQPNPMYAVKRDSPAGQPLWKFAEFPNNIATPTHANGLVFSVDYKKKTLVCLDPKTGDVKWSRNPGTQYEFHGSPTAADGKVYYMDCNGGIYVVAAAPEYKLLHQTQLPDGQYCSASIAVAHKQLFIRTPKTLFCFGAK